MSEKNGGAGAQLLLALALALGGGLLLAIYLIGASALTTMGLILVSALALAVVIGASALPIRAWRRQDYTGERTTIKETHTIDGRPPSLSAQPEIKLFQLPAQPQSSNFPEFMRAAYQAGAAARLAAGAPPPAPDAYAEDALPAQPLGDAGLSWEGDIRL